MTNAEKYLKDKVDARKLFLDFKRYCCKHDCYLETDEFVAFMQEQEKPTLTEDERVILRNICFQPIKDFYILRKHGTLKLHNKVDELYDFFAYDHLFQFIKERRRIRDKGVVRMSGIFNWDYELVGITDEIIQLAKHYDKEITIYKNNNKVVFRYDGAYRFELTFDEVETLNSIIKMARKKRRKHVEEKRIEELLKCSEKKEIY